MNTIGNIFINIPTILMTLLIFILILLFFRYVPLGLWVTAYFSGAKVTIGDLIGMRLRRVIPSRIVNP